MRKSILLLFCVLFPLAFYAQQSAKTYKLKGSAVDSLSQKSVPFATVSVSKLADNSIVKKLVTDADGKFEFELKTAGSFEIGVQMIGYQLSKKNITINKTDKTIELGTFNLKEQTQSINEVTVIAEKTLVKVDAEKLTYNTAQDPDSKTNNVLDMLRKVPLVTVDGDDNIQVKGSSDFKVFINGKPSPMMTSNPKDALKGMPATMVKNIEVITSPGAKYDAEGVGGIINIITEKSSMKGYTANINIGGNKYAGDYGNVSSSAFISATLGKFTFSTNVSGYKYSNPYLASGSHKTDSLDVKSFNSDTDGSSRYYGYGIYGNGDMSYEIDTLNLISGSFNFWHGDGHNLNSSTTKISATDAIVNQKFTMNTDGEWSFGGPQANIDYQHTFKRNKEQTLTISYNINYNPSTSWGATEFTNTLNYKTPRQKIENTAYNIEQTGQIDYAHPIDGNNKLEMGTKFIYRESQSNSSYNTIDSISSNIISTSHSNFDYTQKITSAYFSYNFKYKSLSSKAGLRIEKTQTDGVITGDMQTSFSNAPTDIVPNVNLAYQLNPSQSLKLTYNMRIQRPGLWYLNPYINKTDPQNISYGNPNLESEHYHNIDLNYNIFGKLGNLNLSTGYMYSDNAIDRVTTFKPGNISETTFGNVSIVSVFNNSISASLRYQEKLTLSFNGSLAYRDVKSNLNSNVSTGWNFNGNLNLQYTIVKGFKASMYAGMYKPPVALQWTYSSFYYSGFSIIKEFFDGAMSVSLSGRNIFWDMMHFTNDNFGPGFYLHNDNNRPGRSFGFNISYRLGSMNGQVKKAERGIQNDDVKAGESSSN